MRRCLALALAAALAFAGCSKKEEKPAAEMFWTLRAVSSYLALMESPGARRAWFDGSALTYREFVERAGLDCPTNAAEGRFGVVFVRGEVAPRDWKGLSERLTEGGALAWGFSVKDMKLAEFRRRLEEFPFPEAHLWMPGAEEWLLIGRKSTRPLKLDEMLETFADERMFEDLAKAGCGTLPEMFASYAGTREDVMPAFEGGNPETVVRPEFFLTRDIPGAAWVERGETDDDIYTAVENEVRSLQRVRRTVLEGNMQSAAGEGEKAIQTWARAFLRNPHDPLLIERLERLGVNAHAFFRVGNISTAAKCYETMVLINPKDAAAVRCLGQCYGMLGKKELAAEVTRRADELCRAAVRSCQ